MSAIRSERFAISDFAVTQGGRPALDILCSNRAGRVAALFEHSFYIVFDQSWVCLGSINLPMGPLNVRSTAPEGVIWDACGLEIDDPVSSIEGVLQVGPAFEFATSDAVPWAPPVPGPWSVQTLKAGLAGLDRLDDPSMGIGLGDFITAELARHLVNKIAEAAGRPIEVLGRAVEGAFKGEQFDQSAFDAAVIALLGLGLGLTPSGDDFLGGMLIGLDTLPTLALRPHLFALIERHAPQRTNAISLAHLRAAGAGAGHQALHEILNNLLAGEIGALPDQMIAIDNIGHSSGWDALAGICVTLRAWLGAETQVTPGKG